MTPRDGPLQATGPFGVARTGLIVTGVTDAIVRRVDAAACKILGRDEESIVGRNWRELVDPTQIEDLVKAAREEFADSVDSLCHVVRFVRPDGTVAHALASGPVALVEGIPGCAAAPLLTSTLPSWSSRKIETEVWLTTSCSCRPVVTSSVMSNSWIT
ncbi:PAS domain-containing protein [Pseudofrankia sp. BMG5.37]|uniref:PAS domain-containing protein n=1 Tax=Pseudofrankia sp. BMG5.37 TaxID=3050035 RepID=UPI0028939BF8|nr:PAS domain-containing protein [Pseudofrankia sp. BMG5.37]MDT3446346.1 PAS domain-containing protein [Pseudofrankia sp. BMG5.37]